MNERLHASVATLPDDERKRDRGAFFGSMHGTINHLVWADSIWLSRFTGERYEGKAFGADLIDDFAILSAERERVDTKIEAWVQRVDDAWLASTLSYRASSDGRRRELPAWVGVAHVFNHGTHHRGQLGTLLKQAGVDPGVTDLPWMPGVTQIVD